MTLHFVRAFLIILILLPAFIHFSCSTAIHGGYESKIHYPNSTVKIIKSDTESRRFFERKEYDSSENLIRGHSRLLKKENDFFWTRVKNYISITEPVYFFSYEIGVMHTRSDRFRRVDMHYLPNYSKSKYTKPLFDFEGQLAHLEFSSKSAYIRFSFIIPESHSYQVSEDIYCKSKIKQFNFDRKSMDYDEIEIETVSTDTQEFHCSNRYGRENLVISAKLDQGIFRTETKFYKSKKLIRVLSHENGKREGGQISYYDNGKIKSIGSFVNDLATGEWKFYSENGKLIRTEYYENGKLTHKKGLTRFQKNYRQRDHLGRGIITVKGIGFIDEKTKKSGDWRYYKGQILTKSGSYKNDIKHGEWKFYFKNGELYRIGSYKNGKQDGAWQKYDENGKLKEIVYYENGQLTGEWKHYRQHHEDGLIYDVFKE